MQHLRIGHIHYANCTPIFSALKGHFDCSRYDFVTGVPSRLNAMLRAGEIDLSPSSSIEYALSHQDYSLLPNLSISSIGAVKSVFLYSRVPIETLDGSCIGLTAESDTSVRLLKVLLAKKYGFSNTFERTSLIPDDALQQYPALCVIGDAALKAAASRGSNLVYDLGELWYEFTGLPFVFALWIVRREAVRRLPADLAQLAGDLVRAKEYAYAHYREIAENCGEREWMEPAVLEDYWRTISYDLTTAHLEGARTFFRYAFELGLIPAEPEIRFFDQ
ncbi:menaquinone biosynthetic enzyme MqnA/MqnD family protein [Geomesophilobacter sediminis]|uniref:Chorismate dehydratase n=1 Tax=Geomesophilobacter sediminis TaxID=2798584 RepID=A0A8J7M2C7_9BACT|nr:menaquinone biosynthesis protein [Geomesophilobacter sediminis]MBJ6727463.1 menaquinone biosynthesis protein [Geomesophilobacter sediminis]